MRYLLLGGYAVNYYGHERTTLYLNIWIAVDSQNAQNISKALQSFGFMADSLKPEFFLEPDALFRFGRKPALVEMLTNPSGINFDECDSRRKTAVLDGVEVSLISLDDLKINKKASGRTKDLLDLENLP